MPGRKSTGNNVKRYNSYNAPAKRNGGGSGGKGSGKGLAKGGRGKNNNNKNQQQQQQHKGKYTKLRRDTQIREQPFEYCVVLHAETALPCPSKEVENNENNTNTTTTSQEYIPFDNKQIVCLGLCVLHTPSGTVCGRLQAHVRPPPNAEPLSQYCCDVLNVTQKDVDEALPLVDVLENAEGWIKRIIGGRQAGDPDTVYEIKAKTTKNSSSSTSVRSKVGDDGGKNKKNDDDDDKNQQDDEEEESDDDDEEGEEEEESSSEEDDDDEQGDDSNLPSTTHKIMLAADGVTTIAAIFQGKQQYMDSIIHPEEKNENKTTATSSKKQFSYLNTLSDTIFSRWVDVRECFHRYFRVPYKMRLKLNEMLKEIGLSYQGRGRHAPDMALNVARLMIGSMKKGCIYSFLLECRTSHEQDKVRGIHIGNVTVGGGGGDGDSSSSQQQQQQKNNIDAETLGVLGEWKKRVQNSGEGSRNQFKTTPGAVSNLLASNNSSSTSSSSSMLAVPRSKQGHQVDFFYGKTVFLNEVSIRWLLLVIFSIGSAWNFFTKLF